MFDDFCPCSADRQARRRFRGSIAAAVLLYGSCSAAIVAATGTVQHVVEEELTQVEFAPPPPPLPEPPPPPPPPPPEPAAAPPSPRPKVKRPELRPPDEVPQEKPEESDRPLTAAAASGPVEGFLNGVEGGTGSAVAPSPPPPPPAPPRPLPPPPPPRIEPTIAPIEAAGNDRPRYSPSARRKGIEGSVILAFDVLENGTIANLQVVSGPEELHDTVLRTAPSWHYQPARRGGKAVRFRMKKTIVFRLEDT